MVLDMAVGEVEKEKGGEKMKIPFLRRRRSSGEPKPRQKRQVVTPRSERGDRQQDYLKRISERRKALR